MAARETPPRSSELGCIQGARLEGRQRLAESQTIEIIRRLDDVDSEVREIRGALSKVDDHVQSAAEQIAKATGILSVVVPRLEALSQAVERSHEGLAQAIAESSAAVAKLQAQAAGVPVAAAASPSAPGGKWSWLPAAAEAASKTGGLGYFVLGVVVAGTVLAGVAPLFQAIFP